MSIYSQNYVLALDQGVAASRATLFDAHGAIFGLWQEPVKTFFPEPGWVEQDPLEIAGSLIAAAKKALAGARVSEREIASIGIANQTASVAVWERKTGAPVGPAISWQCRRSVKDCARLAERGHEKTIFDRTGLRLDAAFSAARLPWYARSVGGFKRRLENGDLCFGSLDAWILWQLTGGREFRTDVGNASRTMLMDLRSRRWEPDLLRLFGVTEAALPEIEPTATLYGFTEKKLFGREIPIGALVGGQQASLFGQACMRKGQAKITLGTGASLWCCTGEKPVFSKNGLIAGVAWSLDDRVTYALEGFVPSAGATLQWLKEQLGLYEYPDQLERLAFKAKSSEGVTLVPAFAGLGAPYWDGEARGALFGLTRGTGGRHIARAGLEAIACQTRAVMEAMHRDLRRSGQTVRVDGGLASNELLLQIVADMTRLSIERSASRNGSSLGAAMLAGLAVGFWGSIADVQKLYRADRLFKPTLAKKQIDAVWQRWNRAVARLVKDG